MNQLHSKSAIPTAECSSSAIDAENRAMNELPDIKRWFDGSCFD